METAIKKAIKGGYTYVCGKRGVFERTGDGMECEFSGVNSAWTVWTRKDNGSSICVPHEETVLLPLFWQCLIKGTCDMDKTSRTWWKIVWHRFIDHLASGGDPETFFTNLLQ